MKIEIIRSIIFNIGILVLIAQILAGFDLIKKYLVSTKPTIRQQITFMIIFGGIGIISTSIGLGVNGALANTRVIGVMAGGFICGPLVGIGAAVIAAIHRLAIDPFGFATVSCMVSTLVEGAIAACCSKWVKKTRYRGRDLFFITFAAEVIQMIIILLIAKPFEAAFELVKEIAFPMVFINSIGMVLFVGVFKHIFMEQEYELGKKISLAFDITKKCLPVVKTGLYDKGSCKKIGKIILEFSEGIGVIFTDKEKIIYGKGKIPLLDPTKLPQIAKQVLEAGEVSISVGTEEWNRSDRDTLEAIGAPLKKNGDVFGCLIIFTYKYKLSMYSEIQFVEGLSELFPYNMN